MITTEEGEFCDKVIAKRLISSSPRTPQKDAKPWHMLFHTWRHLNTASLVCRRVGGRPLIDREGKLTLEWSIALACSSVNRNRASTALDKARSKDISHAK
ncbi:hypothetical protein ElyMa_005689000 [Elysia marginata]|uniref:SRCR domain-containing protein n=1 Tax=Elysia marginata TaxID=1093978 RepID=A0AAV4FEU3_9GAST|nr:hypothetical protein ElyMa_005689000 [Elysia marginata]